MADATVKLRAFILTKFMKQVSLCPYLVETDEF
jgi:hypothetical protein